MNRGLLLRAAYELWLPTLVFAAALFAVEAVFGYVLPDMQNQFGAQILQMRLVRTVIQAVLGTDMVELGPRTFQSLPWVHPIVITVIAAHAIVLCTHVPAAEVDRGTIDVLLGLPVSRWQILRVETPAWTASALIVVVAAVAGNLLGNALLAKPPEQVDLAPIVVNLVALHLCLGGITLFCSALSDRRGRAVAGAFGIVLTALVINYLRQFWSVADTLAFLSPLTYYQPLQTVRLGGWPWRDILVLVGIAAAMWTAAGFVFARRDLCTT